MIDLEPFCKTIEQAPNKGVESANCKAIKFDGGFTSQDNMVDYIEIFENGLIMIEMKDLQLKIRNNFENKPTVEQLTRVFDNMIGKFTNSLALIQEEINTGLIPISNYLVWKNDTDTVVMDKYLPKESKERPYQICKTSDICDKLAKLDTRLCR